MIRHKVFDSTDFGFRGFRNQVFRGPFQQLVSFQGFQGKGSFYKLCEIVYIT